MNFFSGANPYASEEDVVADGAPTAAIVFTIQRMSTRLLTTVTARANLPAQRVAYAWPPEINQIALSRR